MKVAYKVSCFPSASATADGNMADGNMADGNSSTDDVIAAPDSIRSRDLKAARLVKRLKEYNLEEVPILPISLWAQKFQE
jgi:hypothetical protein